MNEQPAELPRAAPPDLKALIRRAKLDDAERSSVVAELRGGEIARLELLRDALEPVFAQVPAHAELFDHGLVPSEKPRLFVDIVSFVEMARDRRSYRFIQDTRAGTIVLAESDRIEMMTNAVATYLARRLIEREKALSPPPFLADEGDARQGADVARDGAAAAAPVAREPPARPPRRSPAAIIVALVLGILIGAGGAYAYSSGHIHRLLDKLHWETILSG